MTRKEFLGDPVNRIFFGLIAFTIVVGITVGIYSENEVKEQRLHCEAKGGTLLERTYSSGKSTGHKYTCVDSRVVFE